MRANSSQFVRTWIGTATSGLVEVPINTAYEHDFLAHQVRSMSGRPEPPDWRPTSGSTLPWSTPRPTRRSRWGRSANR